MSEDADNDAPLGSCCQRLFDELNKDYDYKYFFERDGMLAMTGGLNEATDTEERYFTRLFAKYCPFCGVWIMPESGRRKN
jgi:hypothetical protein